MSKCQRCGFSKPANPIGPLFFALNNWIMVVFLNHMTPDTGALWGAENYWINFHWFMWWFSAIGTGIGLLFFQSSQLPGLLVSNSTTMRDSSRMTEAAMTFKRGAAA